MKIPGYPANRFSGLLDSWDINVYPEWDISMTLVLISHSYLNEIFCVNDKNNLEIWPDK